MTKIPLKHPNQKKLEEALEKRKLKKSNSQGPKLKINHRIPKNKDDKNGSGN